MRYDIYCTSEILQSKAKQLAEELMHLICQPLIYRIAQHWIFWVWATTDWESITQRRISQL